jgi:hypothetical protein
MSNYVSWQDVDKTLANREPLYVRNTSPPPRKMLVVDYPSPEGAGKAFIVPRTNVAFNICDYLDPESIRASSSFRKLFNNGLIQVVTAEDAKLEMQDPARRQNFTAAYNEANNTHSHRADEVRKTQEANAAARAEDQKESSAGMKNVIAALDPTLAKALNIVGADGIKNDPKLLSDRNPRLSALETRVKQGQVPVSVLMSELSLMLGDLSVADLQTIASGGIWPADVSQWARERIAFETERARRTV